jgi:hypothetical protein
MRMKGGGSVSVLPVLLAGRLPTTRVRLQDAKLETPHAAIQQVPGGESKLSWRTL